MFNFIYLFSKVNWLDNGNTKIKSIQYQIKIFIFILNVFGYHNGNMKIKSIAN